MSRVLILEDDENIVKLVTMALPVLRTALGLI